jgi:hypothetical protein
MLGQVYTYFRKRLDPAVRRLAPYWPCLAIRLSVPRLRPAREVGPLARADHWGHAAGAITTALSGLERIQDLQVAASRQLDAAEYALQHLLEELRAAMPLPADGAALRAALVESGEAPAADTALAA